MGLYPHLLPGYRSVEDSEARASFEQRWGAPIPAQPGWSLQEMLAAVQQQRLESLYVVGANPWKERNPEELRGKAFLVAQDLFLHETAQAADVILPAASAYEKSGTVTNTCGELQRLRKAMEVLGTRTDLNILVELSKALGTSLQPGRTDDVLQEIRMLVPGYAVSLPNLLAGGAELVSPSNGFRAFPGDGGGAIHSAADTLFTSGTLGRYSRILNLVPERATRKQPDPC
jgi:predicted molibdopterin-dependent oxidoreductase YjgC